ncbi:MAG: ATP-dependent helicase [Cellulosilyticaceae bacterium]
MFDKDWESLNESQRQAVITINENSLVLAPAGTGKTKVIAMRTAHMIRQGALPTSILCLTFTNKAAKEMEERIRGYVPDAVDALTIKTFHSFCYEIIGLERDASHFTFPCTIVDEADAAVLLQRIAQHLMPTESIDDSLLLGFVENTKRYSLERDVEERYDYLEVASDFVKQAGHQHPVLVRFGGEILRHYQNYLKQNNSVDFMDLIVEATYLLEQPEVAKRWQSRYQMIQVDEVQDTSKREYHIIKILAETNCIALFGDFNQTIYEWRGSAPQEMLSDYKEQFAPVQIQLTQNYRSTQVLLKAANNFIKNALREPMQCEAMIGEIGAPIEVMVAQNKRHEQQAIATSIKKYHMGSLGETAILTRTNGYAKDIYKVLTANGIPCIKVDTIRLFRKPEVKAVLSFFHYGVNKRNSMALERMLTQPIIGVEGWLLKEIKRGKKYYMALHDWLETDSEDPYQKLFKSFYGQDVVVLDVESTGLDTTTDEVIQIAAIRYGSRGVQEKIDVLLRPTCSVGDSEKVHGFTDEVLQKEGLDPVDALRQLQLFVNKSVVVGHNIKYDMDILQSMYHRYEQEPLNITKVYDTLDLARKVCPGLADYKLATLAALVETSATPNHNAFYDILATAEVMGYLIGHLEGKSNERLGAIEQYYPYVMPYKDQVESMMDTIMTQTTYESLEYLMNECGFKEGLDHEAVGNLRELYRVMKGLYEPKHSHYDNMVKLLAFTSLHYSEIEQSDLFKNKVPIITVHQAKGLEFENVYIAGCNEGLFPLRRSVEGGLLQEEKRLFYVAMTRAKSKLYLSYDGSRKMSYFVEDIGEDFKKYSQTL